jgi:hypothetical protein
MDFTRLTVEPQILFRKKDRQLYSGGYFTPIGKIACPFSPVQTKQHYNIQI